MLRILGLVLLWPLAALGGEALPVHVSIEPLRYFVERVGGEHVDVEVVVRAGQPPETYEPSPRQVAELANARVLFGVGMPLEASWRKQIGGGKSEGPKWIDLAAELSIEASADAGTNDGFDPHIWLSPLVVQQIVVTIRDELSQLAPARAERFRANTETFQQELEALHTEISKILENSGVESFLVFHPAWGHFARAYGLEQIAVESDGKEPGPRALIKIIHMAKQERIRTLFLDARHSTQLAKTIADAIGGEIKVLDPLSYDYMNNLRNAARAIAASGS